VGRYALQRVMLAVPTLVGLTIVVFFLLHAVVKTDTVDILVAQYGTSDPAYAQKLREEFGLSGPPVKQYVKWVGKMMTGNLGDSLYTKRGVASELKDRLPVSAELALGALFLTLVVAVPIGILSAARQDSLADYGLRGSAILMHAVPAFWLATLILVFGSVWFGWAPPLGYKTLWADPIANIKIMILPMILLAMVPVGGMVRLVRTQVLEVMRQDYVRTARAKGLASRSVYFRHVLRNSMLPVVTVVGMQLPALVAGTVIFEQVFALPGVGRYLLESVQRLDYPVILATNVVFGLTLIVSNIVVDLSYAIIDPRIRFR
jgi:peptide/nickel transport system permease protein